MSFDIKLKDGTFDFNPDGSLKTVANDEKLKQDVVKIVLTTQGTNRINPWYGSPLGERVVGKVLPEGILDLEVKDAINFCIENLTKLQQLQVRDSQYTTPSEHIGQIRDIRIEKSRSDQRQYNIIIDIATKKGTILREVFDIQI